MVRPVTQRFLFHLFTWDCRSCRTANHLAMNETKEKTEVLKRTVSGILLGLAGFLAHHTVHADVYRCVGTAGNTLLTDQPCPPGMRTAHVTTAVEVCGSVGCERRLEREYQEAQERRRAEQERALVMAEEERRRIAEEEQRRIAEEEQRRIAEENARLEALRAREAVVPEPAVPGEPLGETGYPVSPGYPISPGYSISQGYSISPGYPILPEYPIPIVVVPCVGANCYFDPRHRPYWPHHPDPNKGPHRPHYPDRDKDPQHARSNPDDQRQHEYANPGYGSPSSRDYNPQPRLGAGDRPPNGRGRS